MIACVKQLNHDLPTATRCFGKPGLPPRACFRDCTDLFDETDDWLQIATSTAYEFVE